MSLLANFSHWESDVLGCRVGTLSVDLVPSAHAIRSENDGQFDVVFVSCDRWVDPANDAVAVDHLYDMETRTSGEKAKTSCVSIISFPGKKHVAIARNAFRDSRFLRDPRLCDKSPDRYVRWLTEHRVYTPIEAPDSAFLVVTDEPDGPCRISLVAVSEDLQGKGIGARLISGALSMEPTRQVWRVKVSARNHRGIRFYEGLGFRVKSVSTVFHVWMNNGR